MVLISQKLLIKHLIPGKSLVSGVYKFGDFIIKMDFHKKGDPYRDRLFYKLNQLHLFNIELVRHKCLNPLHMTHLAEVMEIGIGCSEFIF